MKLDDICLASIKEAAGGPVHQLIGLKDLLRETTDAYEPDTHAINQLTSGLSTDTVLVLDGGAFPYEAVSKMLRHLRTAMFTISDWPAAILLIVGEQSVDAATTELHSTFYLLPSRRSITEASAYAYRLHRAAAYARLFMWSQAATSRAFNFTNRIERFKRAMFMRDEADKF